MPVVSTEYTGCYAGCVEGMHRLLCRLYRRNAQVAMPVVQWKLHDPTLVRIRELSDYWDYGGYKCILKTHLRTEIVSDRDNPGLYRFQK